MPSKSQAIPLPPPVTGAPRTGPQNIAPPLMAALIGAGIAFALCCAGVLALAFGPGDVALVAASVLIGTALGVGGSTAAAVAFARRLNRSRAA